MIEQYTSPAVVNNSQEPWLVGEGVSTSGSIAIPSLDFDFVTSGLPGTVTFTRASTATYFNSSGVLTSAAINEARLDYNPSTLAARGLLIEEQRTNSIRNNTMQGAVAGTPGTLPTNWQTIVYGTGNSLTTSVIGTGTENGISYVDVRINGTSGTGARVQWYFEPNTSVAASTGQIWTVSSYASLVSGSWTNVTSYGQRIDEFTSGGSYITGGDNSAAVFPAIGLLRTNRNAFTRTLNGGATTAFVWPSIIIYLNSNSAINFTLRIGLPQLEQGAFATSVIPTTTTALTRNADVASVNTLSPWYNATASTLYAEFVWEGLKSLAGQSYVQLDDGTNNNRWIYAAGSSNQHQITTVSGGTGDGSATTPLITYSSNAVYKVAAVLSANNLQAFINGSAGTADTSVTLPVGLNNLKIGANLSATSNVWFRRLTYYPRVLSSAEGIAITT